MFNKIINPESGRMVNLNSKVGKKVIKNYEQFGGFFSRKKTKSKKQNKKPRLEEYVKTENNNFLGLSLSICLHNSEPIEPPAPVTNITFELIFLFNNSLNGVTVSLISISSTSSSLISDVVTLPSTRAVRLGKVRTVTLY